MVMTNVMAMAVLLLMMMMLLLGRLKLTAVC